jgi:hypothetical protein
LLNHPTPETPPDIPPAMTEVCINCDKLSKAEIRKAIATLIKLQGQTTYQQRPSKQTLSLSSLSFSKIWEKEEVPAQWKEGLVIKLPKTGDIRDCSNYRGIMLLSVPGKVLNRVLLERTKGEVDLNIRDQLAGFHKSRSCTDQIASLRIILEQLLEWNSPSTSTS